MKYLLLPLLLAAFLLSGCAGLLQGAKDEAKGQPTVLVHPDGTPLTSAETFQVNAGHMIALAGIFAVTLLTHGLVNAGIVKQLVTSLDTSVPKDSHDLSVEALGNSVPLPKVSTA